MYATALPVTPLPAWLGIENAAFGVVCVQHGHEEDWATPFSTKVAMHEHYQPREIEAAAQSFWDEQKSFEVSEQPGKETYYLSLIHI